ncbi:MAG TPA: hypothetical protein VHQ95_25500 [Pyrinomonadaceae bacterium]|nr:hypothetical protein [Pyrinomonadaceae bacterium]HWP53626.1 hypothetical protein [Pyrinomonadaceae bacterium]
MKNSNARIPYGRSWSALLVALLCGLVVAPLASRARLQATITLTNNSSREITHVYTSPTDRKEWSEDRLPEGSKLLTGESVTLSNVITENDQIKIIAEDKEGCFMYSVVSCAEPATLIVNNSTPRDCGN